MSSTTYKAEQIRICLRDLTAAVRDGDEEKARLEEATAWTAGASIGEIEKAKRQGLDKSGGFAAACGTCGGWTSCGGMSQDASCTCRGGNATGIMPSSGPGSAQGYSLKKGQ